MFSMRWPKMLAQPCQLYGFSQGVKPCRKALPRNKRAMKEGIHPEYREVVFADVQTGGRFITRSTVQTRDTIEIDGKTYPLYKCDVTSESHPFYTGAQTR